MVLHTCPSTMMRSDYGCLQTRFELRRAWDLSSNLSLGGNYIGLILSHSSVPSSRRNQYGLLKNRALLGRCSERDGVPARRWLSFECTAERGRREPCDCFDPSSTHQKASNTRPPLQFCGFTLVFLEPWRVSLVLAGIRELQLNAPIATSDTSTTPTQTPYVALL